MAAQMCQGGKFCSPANRLPGWAAVVWEGCGNQGQKTCFTKQASIGLRICKLPRGTESIADLGRGDWAESKPPHPQAGWP